MRRGGLHIRDGLEVVRTRHGKAALISGNSLGFEIDGVTEAVLALCDGRPAEAVVEVLRARYEEAEIREALEELGSVGAIQVGTLQRFLNRSAVLVVAILTRPLETLFRWSIRGHGDGVLEGLLSRPRNVLLYSLSTDPDALRIPAGILDLRFPEAELSVWRPGSTVRSLIREARRFRGVDLAIGVYDFAESNPHRHFALTWLFGRLVHARRRFAYVDRYDFLPRIVFPYLLSACGFLRARCGEALQRAAVHGYSAWKARIRRLDRTRKGRQPGEPAKGPEKILALAPGGIGDIVLSTPALRALRRRYPQAHVACVVPAGSEDVLRGLPYVDEVIPSPVRSGGGLRSFLSRFSMSEKIAKRGFDVSVTLRHWPGQACDGYLPYLAGIPCRVGPSGAGPDTRKIFTHPVKVRSTHQADAGLEIAGGEGSAGSPELRTTESDRAFIRAYLGEMGIGPEDLVVGIHAGTSADLKQWAPERFAEVADRLALSWGAKVILTGGPGEVKLAWDVARHQATAPVIAAGNLRLSQSIALIARCDLFVCGDSGPMHIASAVGTPVLAVFGPTDPIHWGPRAGNSRVVRRELPCGPRPACAAGPVPECPRGKAYCIEEISVEDVLEAAEALLGARTGSVCRTRR